MGSISPRRTILIWAARWPVRSPRCSRRRCDQLQRRGTRNGARPVPLLLPALHACLDEISHSAFRTSAARKAAFAGELLAMLLLRPEPFRVLAHGAGVAVRP